MQEELSLVSIVSYAQAWTTQGSQGSPEPWLVSLDHTPALQVYVYGWGVADVKVNPIQTTWTENGDSGYPKRKSRCCIDTNNRYLLLLCMYIFICLCISICIFIYNFVHIYFYLVIFPQLINSHDSKFKRYKLVNNEVSLPSLPQPPGHLSVATSHTGVLSFSTERLCR